MAISRKQQAQQTKQKILDAVQAIIREEGIHSVSSLKIVEKAGVSKGTFFHHFANIEDLYLFMLDELVQSIDEGLSPKKFNNLEQFIQASTKFTLAMLDQSPEHVSSIFYFLSQCGQKPGYKAKLKSYLEATFKRWTDNMEHFFPPGLSPAKQDHIVRMLDMYFCGLSFHYLLLEDKKKYIDISNAFSEMLKLKLQE